MGNWQPIETAPKDGTKILVFEPDEDGERAHDTYAVVRWERLWSWWRGYYEGIDPVANPTHWMPLPERP